MKVIIIENENFMKHRIGGISAYIGALVRIFVKNKVSYYCVGAGFENSDDRDIFNHKEYSISPSGLSNLRFFVKLFLVKGKIFKGVEGAVFHLHHPYMALALSSLKQRNYFVLTLHSKQDQSFKNKRNSLSGFIYDGITRVSLKLYDGIIADNKSLLDYYHKKFGFDISIASIISPPVDLDIFKPLNRSALRQKYNLKEADKMILFAGRMEKEKNLELLIRSCRLLINELEQIKLWIVGEGSEHQKLREIADKIDLKHVYFIGNVDRETLSEYINCADVFALTSLHEGGPIVVKEALACNLPVVSVDVGDVAEVIKDLDGCFISSHDVNDLADCLKKAIEYDGLRNYRDRVLGYGVEEFGRKVEEVYEKLY